MRVGLLTRWKCRPAGNRVPTSGPLHVNLLGGPLHQERGHLEDRSALDVVATFHKNGGPYIRARVLVPVRRQAEGLQAGVFREELLGRSRRRRVHHDASGPTLTVPEVHVDLIADREAATQLQRAHAGQRGAAICLLDDVAEHCRVTARESVDACGLPCAAFCSEHVHRLPLLQSRPELVQADVVPHLAIAQTEVVVRHQPVLVVAAVVCGVRLQCPRQRLCAADVPRNPRQQCA
mmetsp:Transcript_63591/g.177986  ORF Transcript_63591/g.177986 Transcript_63591/m.177986 type:complete len:235 (+) Transcript_63591:264-968(+)